MKFHEFKNAIDIQDIEKWIEDANAMTMCKIQVIIVKNSKEFDGPSVAERVYHRAEHEFKYLNMDQKTALFLISYEDRCAEVWTGSLIQRTCGNDAWDEVHSAISEGFQVEKSLEDSLCNAIVRLGTVLAHKLPARISEETSSYKNNKILFKR